VNQDAQIQQLLTEIRDNQREALQRQEEQLRIAREQLERAKSQIAESIGLQREAIQKTRTVMRIAVPGILFCIVLIVYLVVRYF
jgi:t-SNARE complex subunit (syntaxin)